MKYKFKIKFLLIQFMTFLFKKSIEKKKYSYSLMHFLTA